MSRLKVATAACAWVYFAAHYHREYGGSSYLAMKGYSLFNAAFFANHLAREGFVPYISIRVAAALHSFRHLYGIDARNTPRFADFSDFWRAYDEYREWQAHREAEYQEKIRGRENCYECAAPGCGIRAIKQHALRKCGGSCPPATKPHYCSQSCQERVRSSLRLSKLPPTTKPSHSTGSFTAMCVRAASLWTLSRTTTAILPGRLLGHTTTSSKTTM